jgi:hypothetical protein
MCIFVKELVISMLFSHEFIEFQAGLLIEKRLYASVMPHFRKKLGMNSFWALLCRE